MKNRYTSNHWPLDSYFNRLLRAISRKISESSIDRAIHHTSHENLVLHPATLHCSHVVLDKILETINKKKQWRWQHFLQNNFIFTTVLLTSSLLMVLWYSLWFCCFWYSFNSEAWCLSQSLTLAVLMEPLSPPRTARSNMYISNETKANSSRKSNDAHWWMRCLYQEYIILQDTLYADTRDYILPPC